MFNLGALDVVIALVVVLIVLSLVVQSLQQLVKKVLKLKSRTIQRSLEDLLDKVVTPIGAMEAGGAVTASNPPTKKIAGLGAAFRKLFGGPAGKAAARGTIAAEVIDELKSLGRRSLFNNPMLDSIAKEDVVKVLAKIGAAKLYPAYQPKFQQVTDVLDATLQALEESGTAVLPGSASAKIAALQESLIPLVYDLTALSEGREVKASAVLGDLLNVRRVRLNDLFALLGEVQDRVQVELAAAQAAGQDTAGLQTVANALRKAADSLKQLGERIEDAIAPLATKVSQIDLWYDTVMQGFNERYTRHMKSVAVGIAALTVIGLNANFFTMYQAIVSDPQLRGRVVEAGEQLNKNQQRQDPNDTQPQGQDSQGTSKEELQKSSQEVVQRIQAFEALGFHVLDRSEIIDFWSQEAPWGPRRADGKTPSWDDWLGTGLSTLLGWLITILLLSAGAPFWEDVLESLFGLKGLMRQKTATKNVEEGSGGQPKP